MDYILRNTEVHHLLHFCYMFFLPTSSLRTYDQSHGVPPTSLRTYDQSHGVPSNTPASSKFIRMINAGALYEAGVIFRTRYGRHNSLLDITFNRGRIAIPCLVVDDNTNSLLKNLMALERMKRLPPHVCGYVWLLIQLITVPADVELLEWMEIVQNHMSNHQRMTEFINRLSVGMSMAFEKEYSLETVFEMVNSYTGWMDTNPNRWLDNWMETSESIGWILTGLLVWEWKVWLKDKYFVWRIWEWKAWLKSKYFGNPFMFLSLLVAFLFFVLALLQTVYTVYPYYRPSRHQ